MRAPSDTTTYIVPPACSFFLKLVQKLPECIKGWFRSTVKDFHYKGKLQLKLNMKPISFSEKDKYTSKSFLLRLMGLNGLNVDWSVPQALIGEICMSNMVGWSKCCVPSLASL